MDTPELITALVDAAASDKRAAGELTSLATRAELGDVDLPSVYKMLRIMSEILDANAEVIAVVAEGLRVNEL